MSKDIEISQKTKDFIATILEVEKKLKKDRKAKHELVRLVMATRDLILRNQFKEMLN